jgi:hypothetical protein
VTGAEGVLSNLLEEGRRFEPPEDLAAGAKVNEDA